MLHTVAIANNVSLLRHLLTIPGEWCKERETCRLSPGIYGVHHWVVLPFVLSPKPDPDSSVCSVGLVCSYSLC